MYNITLRLTMMKGRFNQVRADNPLSETLAPHMNGQKESLLLFLFCHK